MKVLTVFGTRPEAIKLAPVIKEMHKRPEILSRACVTAQHRQMLDQVLDVFQISPNWDLNIMRENQTLFDVTAVGLKELEKVLNKEAPDIVLVQGDTTTAFVASLAAYYLKIRIGHLEAGLRTGEKYQPFPEEMNRKLIDALCDLWFAPTERARDNLLQEGVPSRTDCINREHRNRCPSLDVPPASYPVQKGNAGTGVPGPIRHLSKMASG